MRSGPLVCRKACSDSVRGAGGSHYHGLEHPQGSHIFPWLSWHSLYLLDMLGVGVLGTETEG